MERQRTSNDGEKFNLFQKKTEENKKDKKIIIYRNKT